MFFFTVVSSYTRGVVVSQKSTKYCVQYPCVGSGTLSTARLSVGDKLVHSNSKIYDNTVLVQKIRKSCPAHDKIPDINFY